MSELPGVTRSLSFRDLAGSGVVVKWRLLLEFDACHNLAGFHCFCTDQILLLPGLNGSREEFVVLGWDSTHKNDSKQKGLSLYILHIKSISIKHSYFTYIHTDIQFMYVSLYKSLL